MMMAERRKTTEAQPTVPSTITSISVHQGLNKGTMGSATSKGREEGAGRERERHTGEENEKNIINTIILTVTP